MARIKRRGDRVIAFLEIIAKSPRVNTSGQRIKLAPFQKRFIREISTTREVRDGDT